MNELKELLEKIDGMDSCCTVNGNHTAIKNIAEINGKVIITYVDNTFTETDLNVVDDSLRDVIKQPLEVKLQKLETQFNEFLDSLVTVRGFDGNILFKAVPND